MSKIVKARIIQMANRMDTAASCKEHINAMIEAHIPYIDRAGIVVWKPAINWSNSSFL